MKSKILLATILLFSIFSAHAQKDIQKGSLLLGGDISYGSTNYTDDNSSHKSSALYVAPSIGIAVKNNLFVGIDAGYRFYKNAGPNNYPNYDSARYHSYNYGIFARKYKPLKSNFYIFLQGNLDGFNSKTDYGKNSTRDYYQKDFTVSLSLTPGVSYGINSKLHLEIGFNNLLNIYYGKTEYRDDLSFTGVRKQTTFNGFASINNITNQLYFGFRFLLQKKTRISNTSTSS